MVKCRNCKSVEMKKFLDLGTAPPSNAYVSQEELSKAEYWVPLRLYVCTSCWLAQTEDFVAKTDVFTEEYAYFSSMSDTWLAHASAYVDNVCKRFVLNESSLVIEVAANDGYLLGYLQERGIPCIGIEPTHSTAEVARSRGLTMREVFLNGDSAQSLVEEFGKADLVVGNNVFAHVPDVSDFARALRTLVSENGVVTLEFPSIVELIEGGLFDTVYHEHFSYFSLTSAIDVLGRAGLVVFDVEELSTHGGSLRVFAQCKESAPHHVSERVKRFLKREQERGVCSVDFYQRLQGLANGAKLALLDFLISQKKAGLTVAGYGAAAKGNTLLNYSGVREDLLSYVVDKSPGKVGKFLPGSRIPIRSVDNLLEDPPDSILILPWNLAQEVIDQLRSVLVRTPPFYVAIPEIRTID